MDDKALDRLFTGDLDQLVHLPKRVVRLFISSTFTDMMLERNSLMERVYPKLKKYCRERHGLDFQVVDMRWGVRDEATDDHQTANLCSREIDNCQRMSLGPNFVALIGDKYGFRPLCNKIKSTEYRALRRCLLELDISTDFLDTWYREDLNAVPAEYLLQPISSILKNFTNKNEPELQSVDQRIWQTIQQRLHELLMIGSSRLVEQGRMSKQDQLMKYSISVTEREVIEGCLNVKEAKSSCLVYVRTIVDIRKQLSLCLAGIMPPQQLNTSSTVIGIERSKVVAKSGASSSSIENSTPQASSSSSSDSKNHRSSSLQIGSGNSGGSGGEDTINLLATRTKGSSGRPNKISGSSRTERRVEKMRKLLAKYVDLRQKEQQNEWSLDEEAQSLLGHLRAVKLEAKLGSGSGFVDEGSSVKVNSRALSKFKVFWDENEGISLKSEEHKRYLNELTDHFYTNMTKMIRRASRDDQEIKAGLIGEVLQHSHYAKHVSRSFYGRSTELDQIRSYILSPTMLFATASATASESPTSNVNDEQTVELMPMFVYGVGGSGKTSVLARAATLAKEWIERARSLSIEGNKQHSGAQRDKWDERWDLRPCIIMRFCCTTPSSSSMVGVLTSVCRQLQYNFYQFGPLNGLMNEETGTNTSASGFTSSSNQQQQQQTTGKEEEKEPLNAHLEPQLAYEPIAEDFVRLVFTFRQLVENCRHHYHKNRLFVIILDSVERLTAPAESSIEVKYSWLTSLTKLPPNVRLIVSCSSELLANNKHQQQLDTSGKGSSNMNDFIHLKRHFLRLYFPLDKNNRANESSSDSKNHLLPSTKNRLNSDSSVEMANHLGEIDKVANIDANSDDGGQKEGLASHLLKRLVIPAMRLRRGSQRLLPLPAEVSNNNSLNIEQSGAMKRSASSLGFQQTTKVVNKVAKLIEGHHLHLQQQLQQQTKSRSPSLGSRLSNSTGRLSDNSLLDDSFRGGRERGTRGEKNPVNMIHVKPMGVDLASNVVRLWLQEVGRTLTQQQWSIVRRSFSQCSRPIFVKLAFGEIVNWKSYSVQSDSKGLTFGSSLLEGNRQMKEALKEASNDPNLRLLMEHYKPSLLSSQFKRQTLNLEREWLNYLSYSQRKSSTSGDDRATSGSGGLLKNSMAQAGVRLSKNGQVQLEKSGEGVGVGVAPSKSWSGASSNICHLSSTIDEAVNQLFARIELQHGYLLTKHSLSYITAARNGICENELEDILSLDDVVLDDVFQYHLPPVRRIPPLLWTRIRNDLPDYLSERDADGIVVNWHHNQFKLVAQRRYLQDKRQILYIHSNLADYFLGRWADVAKPFRCTKQQVLMAAEQLESAIQQSLRDSASGTGSPHKSTGTSFTALRQAGGRGSTSGRSVALAGAGGRSSRLRSSEQSDRSTNWMQAKADRRVPHQPLHYAPVVHNSTSSHHNGLVSHTSKAATNENGEYMTNQKKRYNLRKITELPYHLMRSGRFLDLANEILFNYKWLYAAIDATGLQNLLSDFEEATKSLQMALEEKRKGTETDDQIELTGTGSSRSNRKEELDAENLESMISQLDILNNTIRLSSSAIHSDTQMLAPQLIGRLLPLTRPSSLAHTAKSGQLKYLNQLLEQCDRDGCLDCGLLPTDHCLQAPDGLQLSSLEGHSFAILSMAMANDQRHLLAVSNRFIMWDTTTGEVSRNIDPKCEGSMIMGLKMGLNDEYAIAYTSSNTILVLDILTQQIIKFHHFEIGSSNPEEDLIIGLELVDLYTASKFVVWTKRKWFVLNLSDNEVVRSVSMPQRISIELEKSFDLTNLNSGLAIQRVHHDEKAELSFIEAISNSSNELRFLTVARSPESGNLELWKFPENISIATSLCLDPLQRQLVISNNNGQVFLVRRRNTLWSKPKLIWSRNQQLKINEDENVNSLPLAIDLNCCRNEERSKKANRVQDNSAELAAFEQRIDGAQIDDELEASASLYDRKNRHSTTGSRGPSQTGSHLTTVLLYLNDRIVVLHLDTKVERNLLLPRDIRNISVEPNKCQIKAIVLGVDKSASTTQKETSFLAASVGRRLLLYSLVTEQFLRLVDAHAARIVQLMPIVNYQQQLNNLKLDDDRWLSFASASMDKTVKIWNLDNLDKDVHTLDKLNNPIESMSMAKQRPWVACLGRSELGLFDWRTMRLLARLSQHELMLSTGSGPTSGRDQKEPETRVQLAAVRFVSCRLSSDGRYLCLATMQSIHLFQIQEFPSSSAATCRLKACAEHKLPKEGLVRSLKFFQQDSRLLTSVECPLQHTNSTGALEQMTGSRRMSEETNDSSSAGTMQMASSARRLLIFCHSIPDGHLLYTIDSITPTISHQQITNRAAAAAASSSTTHHQLNVQQQHKAGSSSSIRLPVLTRDHLHVVIVESEESTSGQHHHHHHNFNTALTAATMRKRQSVAVRPNTLLGVYSARDGLLLRRINLNQLEVYNPTIQQQQLVSSRMSSASSLRRLRSSIETEQVNLSFIGGANAGGGFVSNKTNISSIGGDQFCLIKSVASYRERQSIVALLDHERAISFLVDVNSRQLMASSSIWNGKLSSNGRFGLSRMYKSSSSSASSFNKAPFSATTASNNIGAGSNFNQVAGAGAGLQLLEMGHCSPVKRLLTHETLNKLSGATISTRRRLADSSAVQQQQQHGLAGTGNDSDISCGFVGPQDSHVFYHDARLARLLLIRLQDAHLVANYKLSTRRVTKIKCSNDGYALVLGSTDGSLTSLAIVDPQKDDTLVRLSQYPSRKERSLPLSS